MRLRHLAFSLALVAATRVNAQTQLNHVGLGDRDYAALNAPGALAHYKQALAAEPTNYEALWKVARSAADVAEFDLSGDAQAEMFGEAESYSRRAVAANPNDAEGHFHLARALGKRALTLGVRQKIKYGTEVRAQALECLRLNPKHAGCFHVMGLWNAEVMRLNGFSRMIAKNLLGGKVFGAASWAEAQRNMEEAVALEPKRIIHHLHLGDIYRDRGDKLKARAEYQAVLDLPVADYNDRHYKVQASAALKAL